MVLSLKKNLPKIFKNPMKLYSSDKK